MPSKKSDSKRLYRSEDDRIIAGVAGGIAEYFDVDPLLVRIIAALAILSGGGVVLYILLWIFVPTRRTAKLPQNERIEKNAEELSETAQELGRSMGRGNTVSILLIVLGIFFLLNNLNLIPWQIWHNMWKLWPVVLILIGLSKLGNK